MKKVFTLAFALFICSAAFAQFTNAKSGSRGGNSGGIDFGEMSYKGFIEAGYAIGLGDDNDGDKPEVGRFDISTSHGVQFGGHFFAGLGTGFKWFSKDSENYFNIPVFADLRANLFEDNNINPFIGLKIGYAIGIEKKKEYYDDYYDYYLGYYQYYYHESEVSFGGFICTPTIGCRFDISEKMGLGVSVGYDIQKGKFNDEKFTANGLVFKVGVDF